MQSAVPSGALICCCNEGNNLGLASIVLSYLLSSTRPYKLATNLLSAATDWNLMAGTFLRPFYRTH